MLNHQVRDAVEEDWKEGDRFKIPLEGKWFYGIIEKMQNDKGFRLSLSSSATLYFSPSQYLSFRKKKKNIGKCKTTPVFRK